METWQVAGVIGIALLFGGKVTNAVELSVPGANEKTFDFDIPALPLRNAAEAFAKRIGRDTYIGHDTFQVCSSFILRPLVGTFTAQEAWRRLTAPICAASGVVIERPGDAPVYMVDHPWVAKREIHIPRVPLLEALETIKRTFPALLLEYRTGDPEQAQQLVGPIQGTFAPDQVLQRIEEEPGLDLHHQRVGPDAFVLEAASAQVGATTRYLYPRACDCPVIIDELSTETVIVAEPAFRASDSYTREQIEATGAATLPQFFHYLAQNGYSRPEGYIASGAQYADFRGLGRDTHLVTINGRRTLPSANNITSSAFDLNTIPLPAVERVDIHVNSASMRSGSDAIAGTIDIITRRELAGAAQFRYGFARGGAQERRATLSTGHQGSAGGVAVLLDYFETGDLLGAERALSRDQDYSRYGGADYRAAFAIRSLNGANLPGLPTSVAGIPVTRQSDALSIAELRPGEPQRVSLSRYQSVVPATRRASLVGSADYSLSGVTLAADVLWVKRDASYHHYPAIAAGVVSADHPGNPFDQPFRIEALLTGAPSMQQHVESELQRAVLSATGAMGAWRWDMTVLGSDEKAVAWLDHTLDGVRTAAALLASEEGAALDVFAMRPGGPDAPSEIWARPVNTVFSSSGAHLLGGLNGPIGVSRVTFGLEQRREAMQFNASVGRVERKVRGGFAHLMLPLVTHEHGVFGMKALTASAGVRQDDFKDANAITRRHVELTWDVNDRFSLEANRAQQYRPPTLFELNLPKVSVPVQVFDRRREEAVAALMIAGGNPHLRPTTGTSTHLQARYESPNGLSAKLHYFSINLWNRIAALPMPVVLAAQDQLPDRVVRAPRTPEDIEAGRPGRLLSIDTTRDNVGRLSTRGLDASIRQTFDTALGAFTPQLDLTWIDTFRYSDSPVSAARMIDRVGIASEQGTITPWRAVLSLGWQADAWAAMSYVRLIPAYQDVGGGVIRSQQLLDLNVSYAPSPKVMFTIGAMDLANTSPHFANIGAATGYDSSQWDPVGRRVMLTAKVSL